MEQVIDTLATYRKLGDAEFPERQAEAIVEAMSDTMGNLVTYKQLTAELDKRFGKAKEDHTGLKGDFADLKTDFAELKTDFADLKTDFADLKTDFAELKTDFAELKSDFRKFDAKLETEIAKSQKLMMATVLGSSLTIIAIQVATLLSVLGPLLAIVE